MNKRPLARNPAAVDLDRYTRVLLEIDSDLGATNPPGSWRAQERASRRHRAREVLRQCQTLDRTFIGERLKINWPHVCRRVDAKK